MMNGLTIDRRRLLTLTAAGVSVTTLGPVGPRPSPPIRSAGYRRAAPSRCSTTIPTGSARSSAISATSRRRSSPDRRTHGRASSSSTRTRPTVGYPVAGRVLARPDAGHSDSSRCSRWAAPTCSTSPSARARRRPTSRASKARPSCSAAPAGRRSPIRCWRRRASTSPRSNMSTPAGRPGAQRWRQGQGDAALSWEGLRAQWKGQGLDFDYILGRNFSKLPANSFVIRKADFEDAAKRELYTNYSEAGPPGSSSATSIRAPRRQIVMEQFPGLASQMSPAVATESMMQLGSACPAVGRAAAEVGLPPHAELAAVLRRRSRDRPDHRATSRPRTWCQNDLVDGANNFDEAKVKADADGFALAGGLQGGRRRGDPRRALGRRSIGAHVGNIAALSPSPLRGGGCREAAGRGVP